MSKKYFAFKQDNPCLVDRLITEVSVFTPDKSGCFKARALWDTGAAGTVITPRIVKTLRLTPIDKILVSGIHKTDFADLVHVSAELPNGVMCDDIDAMVCDLNADIDMLVGMDIICNGDFALSNAGGKTLFTFAIPPFESKTDHYQNAAALNNAIHA